MSTVEPDSDFTPSMDESPAVQPASPEAKTVAQIEKTDEEVAEKEVVERE